MELHFPCPLTAASLLYYSSGEHKVFKSSPSLHPRLTETRYIPTCIVNKALSPCSIPVAEAQVQVFIEYYTGTPPTFQPLQMPSYIPSLSGAGKAFC